MCVHIPVHCRVSEQDKSYICVCLRRMSRIFVYARLDVLLEYVLLSKGICCPLSFVCIYVHVSVHCRVS